MCQSWRVESDDGGMEIDDFALTDGQVPIKDLQKLSFNPAYITLSKDASRDGPVDVLKSGIIRELDQDRHQDSLPQRLKHTYL